ncbi:hypothetical protein RvY_08605 [Ramazzottius varieornatus]|uniref:SUEL-type lectin domain-containing protein n=1 Tax=Ramazzottius varieornatus TaxID=947166 RepID=A0A1D1V8Q1_RAMVA|nr:hypothetical protein RvY_08605 [Ramazzottius varieornatus]
MCNMLPLALAVSNSMWILALSAFLHSVLAYCAPLLESTTPSPNLHTAYVPQGYTKFYECVDPEKPFFYLEQMEWEAVCDQAQCDTVTTESCNLSQQASEVLKIMRQRCRPGNAVCEVFADDTDLIYFCPTLPKTGSKMRLRVEYKCLDTPEPVGGMYMSPKCFYKGSTRAGCV